MAVLYEKGIVVIPKRVWHSAGFKKGMRLHISSEGRKVIIEPEDDALALFRSLCSGAYSTGREVDKQIKAAQEAMESEASDVH